MVRGSVEKHYDSVSPSYSILLREYCCELRQKHLHDVLVRVALSQWKPNEALRRHSADQVDFVPHGLLRQRVVFVRLIPAVWTKVGCRYPGFVYINHVCSFWVDLEHFTRIQVPKNSVLLRVANVCDSLDATVTEVELLLQDSDDSSKRYLCSCALARFKLDLLGIPDALPSCTRWMNCTNDACLFSCLS